jgi:predicted metal-dependent hydrolase
MFFAKKRTNYKTWFESGTAHVPVQVRFEARRDARASIGRSGLIVRFPHSVMDAEIPSILDAYIKWASDWLSKKPDMHQLFVRKDYSEQRTLTVGRFEYIVHAEEIDGLTAHQARRKENHVYLRLVKQSSELAKHKAVKTLLSRIIAQHQKPWVVQRVLELNAIHFQRPVRNVYLKYNHSNWGSCSVGSNINLSTRLLFAPPEVIDYVIIHELAHLIEQNHSDRFWAQVARAMPDYDRHERWLKDYGKTCDF